MPPKADSPVPAPPSGSAASGKLVIIGILAVALAAAGISWWFRFHTTHRAAEFWGPEAAQLIRDAPTVMLSTFSTPVTTQSTKIVSPVRGDYGAEPQVRHNVTSAKGLVHLRNALLEDQSFNWPSQPTSPFMQWEQALIFSDSNMGRSVYVLFSPELKLVASVETNRTLSYETISEGVAEMFAEFESLPADNPAAPAR